MQRVFALGSPEPGGPPLAYDPCSGTARLAPPHAAPGRARLDDAGVRDWPAAGPAERNRNVPVSVCWSPIVRCNLACDHCLDDTTVPEAAPEARAGTARVLAASGILGADISGGEPLLLRDLPELAGTLAAGGLAVSVTTNGWHLARRAAELARCLDAVRVSLDGPDASSHDRRRGPGSFARALDGIAAATAAGLPVQVQTVLMASSAPRAQDMLALAARAGASGVTFLQMLPFAKGSALTAEMLTDAEAAALTAALQVPAGLGVRLRTRDSASGFTVIRADGRVWRNAPGALAIQRGRPLAGPRDLALAAPGGGT